MRAWIWIIAWYGLLAAHFGLWWAALGWDPDAAAMQRLGTETPQADASAGRPQIPAAADWKTAVEQIFALEELLRRGGADVAVYAPLVDWIELRCTRSAAAETLQWQVLVATIAGWMSAIANASEQLVFERCSLLPDTDGWPVLLLDGMTAAASLGRWLSQEGFLASPWDLRELELVRIEGASGWWFHGVWAISESALP